MNISDLDALIHACLDGRATDEEMSRIEGLLATDPGARDRYLCLADLHACLAIDEALWQEAVCLGGDGGPAVTTQAVRTMSFRVPFAAAAVGLIVGLCGAGLAFGYVVPMLSRPFVIFADGFESGPAPECHGLAGRTGIWSGDESQVVPVDQGVTPAQGRRMLRLLRADYPGKSGGDSFIADTFRVIDLRPYRDLIGGGAVVATITARCNAAEYPAEEAYTGDVCMYAIDAATFARLHDIPDVDLPRESLAMAHRRHACFDRNPMGWQPINCELRLPSDADCLVLRLSAAHGPASQRRATFGGHYLDDVVVSLQEVNR
ncbi:MAG: hypothetical protein K8S94_05640 [Planctomycetia bacterium]|nr:hypothetical protein [Planctomycetia bacterium]